MRNCTWLLAAVCTFTMLACPLYGHATTTGASTCSLTDVSNAIAVSSYGDTVVVPAGSCTWSSALIITRGITLTGAGAGQTNITGGGVTYEPDSTSLSTDARMEISGFTFTNANVWINPNSTTIIHNVLIHDNTLTSSGGDCLTIAQHGEVRGVIYSNNFLNCAGNSIRFFENSASSWNNTTFGFGTSDSVYVEDNTFTGNSFFHYGDQSTRYVARFNTYHFTSGPEFQLVWDMHGVLSSGNCSTMGAEIYNNTVQLDASDGVLDHRGGELMFFRNTVTGSVGSWQVRAEYAESYCPNSNVEHQHPSNSYYFLNTFNGSNQGVSISQSCCGDLNENQQFWNYVPSGFNGSVGIGSGTKAQMNAITSCTAGVGFWVTDEGSWNTTVAPNTSGQLYHCTGNASPNQWALYYTPYTYPHPLRGNDPPPVPPTHLAAVVQ